MVKRTTITLDDEAVRFLEQKVGSNRSAYINELVHNEAKRDLQAAVIKANEEEASEHNKEMKLWEGTLLDGLEP